MTTAKQHIKTDEALDKTSVQRGTARTFSVGHDVINDNTDTALQDGWWNDFFDDIFAAVLLDRPDMAEREAAIAFFENHLNITPGDTIFDQCCGTGSLSRTLAAKGYHAIGVDIIPSYITKAQRLVEEGQIRGCSFACSDARIYAPDTPCDAAINWYTSFGYSQDDTDNMNMLHRIFGALKPGGKMALDLTNMSLSMRQAEKTAIYEQETDIGMVKVERRFTFDIPNGMRGSTWRYTLPDGSVQEKSGSSRLYAPREIDAMLRQCGFENITFFGDVDGSPLTMDSPRCICTAQKTE